MGQIILKSAVPILFVRDVPASAAFFKDKLSFSVDSLHGDPSFYGSVSRGSACLHLRFVQEPNFKELAQRKPSLILATIEVSDVYALFAEFEALDVEFAQTVTEQTWGGTDFQIRDPDGNAISFVSFT